MFFGSSRLQIDEKGRIAIPARARADLAATYGTQVAITLGPEAIELYPASVFRQRAAEIAKIPDRDKRMLVMRMFIGHASECEPDGQGRVLIPALLRQMTGVGAEALLSGAIDHFELWPAAGWQAMTEASKADYAAALAALPPS